MQFTAQQLIDAARTLVDDNHDADSWIASDVWIQFLNWSYQTLYRKLVQKALVSPATTDQTFTGYTATVNGVLAVVGVAEDLGDHFRLLAPSQSSSGRAPFWVASSSPIGKSVSWAAYGSGDNYTMELNPRDPTGNYVVRYIPRPAYLVATTDQTVDLPAGMERLIVYGMVAHAMIKDTTASAALQREIQKAEDELGLGGFGRINGDSPRVRRVRPQFHRHRWPNIYQTQFPMDPDYWIYP